MVYGSETWATKADDIQRLERAERAMVRWMCGVKLKDRRSNRELLDRLHVVEIGTVVSRGRLGWYDHVERMPKENGCHSAGSWKWKKIKGVAEAEARRPGGRVWRKTGNNRGLTGGMCRTMLDGVVVFLGTVQPAHALKNPVPTFRAKTDVRPMMT